MSVLPWGNALYDYIKVSVIEACLVHVLVSSNIISHSLLTGPVTKIYLLNK